MSIRLRLTLLYSAILALTLIVFSVILYAIQSRYTLNVQRRDLALNAQRIARGLARVRTFRDRLGPRFDVVNPDRPGSVFGERELRELRVRDMVRVLNVDGTVIEHPINQEDTPLPLSDEGLQAIQNGETWVQTASVEGERFLVYSSPVLVEGQVTGIVQVARSLTDRDRALKALAGTLLVGSLLITLAAFGIGWVLSGITLRPIHRITQTAQAIGSERDLTRRVQYAGPNDEVGRLAITFNQMLDRLQATYRQVERSLEMQRDFIADVSHELRTPLTTIRGNLALLRRQPPISRGERDDVLTDMVDESERLIRLVNDLLTLARADAGQQVMCERVELEPLIQDVCRQAWLLAPERAIDCSVLTDAAVVADRDALKQVLLILLDNAIKHSVGPVTVTTAARDRQIAISVRDAGPGMDPETRSRIFDRFYQGGKARTTPGWGLGLPIAKALIEAQKGTITVESQMERGSVFTVALPQADLDEL